MAGVSIEFFTKSIKLLEKMHGPRTCGPGIEAFRDALEQAEKSYKSLPPSVKVKKKPAQPKETP